MRSSKSNALAACSRAWYSVNTAATVCAVRSESSSARSMASAGSRSSFLWLEMAEASMRGVNFLTSSCCSLAIIPSRRRESSES